MKDKLYWKITVILDKHAKNVVRGGIGSFGDMRADIMQAVCNLEAEREEETEKIPDICEYFTTHGEQICSVEHKYFNCPEICPNYRKNG